MPPASVTTEQVVPAVVGARAPLVDAFGRVVRDVRISVTDRCNFRCTYCMPADGLPWQSRDEHLSVAEFARVARVLVESGVESCKVTGGEPLVRKDCAEVVRALRAVSPTLDISLTTNGVLLEAKVDELVDAGLDRVTISCDSLLRHRFAEITRRDALDRVLAGARAAAAAGLTPVKVNTVVMRGVNEDEVVEFARLARDTGYEVRFIEYMPLDAGAEWKDADVVTGAEVLAAIDAEFPLVTADAQRAAFLPDNRPSSARDAEQRAAVPMDELHLSRDVAQVVDENSSTTLGLGHGGTGTVDANSSTPAIRDAAPATSWRFADGAPGGVGVITSVSEPFCASCDRLRLTADGQLRACLFSLEESDLRAPLRAGASDDQLHAIAARCIAGKWAGHKLGQADFVRPARSMSMIGG